MIPQTSTTYEQLRHGREGWVVIIIYANPKMRRLKSGCEKLFYIFGV